MAQAEIRRLQSRILIFSLAGILITGLVVGLATAIPHYRYARQQSENAALFHVKVQATAVAQLLDKWRDLAMQVTSRSRIRDKLVDYNNGRIDLQALRAFSVPKLADALGLAPGSIGMMRLDAAGEGAIPVNFDVPRSLWPIPGPNAQDARIIGPVRVNGQWLLLVGAPIIDRAQQRVGTDVLAFSVDPLLPLLGNLNGFGEHAVAWLARQDQGAMLRVDNSGYRVMSGDQVASLRKEINSPGIGRSGALVRLQDATDRVLIFAPMGNEWSLLVTLPDRVLYAPALQEMVIPLFSVLLMALLGTLVTLRVIRPLGERTLGQTRQLAQLAAEQQLVLENARDYVYRHDLDGTLTYVSPSIEQVTGYSKEQWLLHRKDYVEKRSPDDGLSPEAIASGRTEAAYQVVVKHPNGSAVVLDVNEQVYLEDGVPAGVVGIARDVTEREHMQQQLTRVAGEWADAMDTFEDGVAIVDDGGHINRANQAFFQMLHVTAEKAVGRTIHDVMTKELGRSRCRLCSLVAARQDAFETLEADDPDNPTGLAVEVVTKVVRDGGGAHLGTLLALRDLTRIRQTAEELHLAASVFEGTHDGIIILNPEYRIVRVNQAFSDLTGLPVSSVGGNELRALLSDGLDERVQYERIWDAVAEHGQWQGEVVYRRANGEVVPVWQRVSVQLNSRGEVVRYINLITDITEKKRSEARIHHLAHFDVLTDLPNRAMFEERLRDALQWSARRRRGLALLFIDLDRFKNVNDSLGHPMGDQLLKVMGERLCQSVRSHDVVARLGGDEFTVILEDVERDQAVSAVAQKILESLCEPVNLGNHEVVVGGSIGIAMYPDDGWDAETLIKNADTAMFHAKERGRNAYRYYDAEMGQRTSERFELEAALRGAVERNELRLYYQPLVDLASGRIIGAESLLRWAHGRLGMIAPDDFIPLAEESGLIEPIGHWVLAEGCRQFRQWLDRGFGPMRLAVNVSGYQILYGDIVGAVTKALQDSGLAAEYLELEITESFVMAHPEHGVESLHALREMGVGLAVDDFGTGYSSLAYLKQLPVNRLKIDRSFVHEVPANKDDTAIVSTIIAMAQHLELEVIAEGVESEAQLHFLKESGCQEYQGYFCSRPLPADEFEALLRNGDSA